MRNDGPSTTVLQLIGERLKATLFYLKVEVLLDAISGEAVSGHGERHSIGRLPLQDG